MNIIKRVQWGARQPKQTPVVIDVTVHDVFVHHSATPAPLPNDEVAAMRSVQNYHMDTNGWNDIGYSFVVMPSGNVYEGRGWGVVGAHTEGHNSTGYGICVEGNYMQELPALAALQSVAALIDAGIAEKWITVVQVFGHRDVFATACPGDNLYSKLDLIRGLVKGQPTVTNPEPTPPAEIDTHSPLQFFVPTPSGKGYWMVAQDGAVFAFGDAAYYGRVWVK